MQMIIISTTVGRNPLEEMEWPSWSTKETKMQYLDAISKMTEWSLCPRQIIQYTAIQVYALTSNAEEAEVEQFCEGLQDLLELTSKKDVLFIIWNWNEKVESQEISGKTGKFGLGVKNEVGQRLSFAKRTHWS